MWASTLPVKGDSGDATVAPCRRLDMIRSLLFTLALSVCGASAAQNSLEPCREAGDPYHAAVNRIIDKAVAKPARLQLTVFPSFETESGIRLVGSDVYFVEFQSSHWADSIVADGRGSYHMDFSKPKIVTKVHRASLNAGVADRIQQVFTKAIVEARSPGEGGLDGVSYVFSTSSGQCGSAWSPGPQTRNGRLVQLMERLARHAGFTAPLDLARSEKSLARLIKKIEAD